ncbi:hypothetical protein SAMN05444678_102269 [Sphingomonas sp. YR710]|uniref:hypothetical protein n=1 Tax=Sphingomonas sp. YR710 TaxID=1882773 RepID=UPI00088BB614|nr:hypothetical protein [Sphingomonas sp. YR710]SDC31111.1 hypothetical protein SAMN05444678_102269 [Sphingomonas sp. YR710]
MTIIAFPNDPKIAQIMWTPPAKTQINRSTFVGRRRGTILPSAGFWKCQVSFPLVMSEAEFLPWRAFLLACNGQANSFRIEIADSPQTAATSVLVNGAGQAGLSLATDGWPTSGIVLKAGHAITVGEQPIVLAADAVASGGAATLSLSRVLRSSPADNAPVEVRLPTALMASEKDDLPYTALPGQMYQIQPFGCEEAF